MFNLQLHVRPQTEQRLRAILLLLEMTLFAEYHTR